MTNEDEIFAAARKQVKKIKGFYAHLTVYLLVNTGLAALNLLTTPQHIWFIWSLFGWGIGVASHGLSAYDILFCKEWEDRKTREIAAKMQGYNKIRLDKDA
jgi:hypothetical protein